MEYICCKDASNKTGISVRRIQQLCKQGKVSGAIKDSNAWLIPENALMFDRKPLPIGVSDFKSATNNYYYVDKTLLIRDFLDERPMVSLFTRPRRFGKTLNMDMLRVFFEKTNEDTSVYFKDKKIWKCGENYISHQGKYPVIFLTFKDVKCLSWQETLEKLKSLISKEFVRHLELETSDELNVYEKELYHKIASNVASEIEFQFGLQTLSLLLYKHYKQKVVIIIDEYDTPIGQGHTYDFYDKTINFMRSFFSGGLKDNNYLAFGFLTGILRVAKESIFSGMNNLKVSSIMDDKYGEYFGFKEDEIKQMLSYYGKEDKLEEICDWYDGYKFGECEIFNPWSVINYIGDNCTPKAFWQSTGSNDIIGEIMEMANDEINEDLYKLLNKEVITTYIDTNVIYQEIKNNPYSIYSFLLMAGYLKASKIYPQDDGAYMCDVAIPNKEIAFVYKKEILNKLNKNNVAISISQAIFTNDIDKLQELLKDFMLNSISGFDGSNEAFYHGMLLGLCVVLGNKYAISSNRESGLGRLDIELKPLVKNIPAFIFEVKYSSNKKEDLGLLANKALKQIDDKKYDNELVKEGINNIIKIGIAFRGKDVVIIEK